MQFEKTNEKKRILIEYQTPSGSAFAVDKKGDTVFLNTRIVQSLDVQVGEVFDAYVLPNYPDKRETTPWRAMRIERVASEGDSDELKRLIEYMNEFEDGAVFTVEEIAFAIDVPVAKCEEILRTNRDVFAAQTCFSLRSGHE